MSGHIYYQKKEDNFIFSDDERQNFKKYRNWSLALIFMASCTTLNMEIFVITWEHAVHTEILLTRKCHIYL